MIMTSYYYSSMNVLREKIGVKEQPEMLPENMSQAELAHQQALRFAKDLAEIFKIEKARREELQIAYQQLQTIFANTPAGLVVLDEKLTIQQANPMFCKWMESKPEAVQGKPLAEVLAAEPLIQEIEAGDAADEPAQVELVVTEPVPRAFVAHVARLESRRAPGWIVVLQDHSERKKLEYQKAEFINIAAHELRTPMSPILGYSLILLEDLKGQIDEVHWTFLESIYTGASRLQRRVDELVAFANMSRGDLWKYGISKLQLANLVEDVLYEMQPQAEESEISLEMNFEDPAIALNTDAALLRIVLNQLISNGIKFNNAGGYVQVEAEQTAETTTIRVVDNGIGMPQAELNEIFQMFFQIEDHRTRSIGGLGLGLPLVQHAITQLNGTLSVNTTLGEGTTFILELPNAGSEPEPSTRALSGGQITRVGVPEGIITALSGIVEAVENREIRASGHARRVTYLALRIARQMGFSQEELSLLKTAALLHDIGKVSIPEAILHKTSPYSDAEREIYQRHVTLAREILEPITGMQPVISIILAHHERWDGKGYPQGLVGAAIPQGARILAVANAYDTMTNVLTEDKSVSRAEVLEKFQAEAGDRWDPDVVEALMTIMQSNSS